MHKIQLVAMLAKIVDFLLLTAAEDDTNPSIEAINDRFELGTVVSGPGAIRYFGLNVTS